jgi:DNA polymerase III alpha subunit
MSKLQNFSSPHCHLQSLDTATTLDEFVRREVELETGTLTCTDHGYLGACRDAYRLAKENKLTPILGIEGYHRDDNCDILGNAGFKKDSKGTYQDIYKYGHITIHALDQKSFEFIIKKTSDRDLTAEQHGSERKPIFTWDDLEEIGAQNVTYTTGCLIGVVGRHFKDGRVEIADKYYDRLRSFIKQENFYVELFTHKCDKNWVSGAFLTLEGGETKKYYLGKKVKTEEFEEISVADLAKAVGKGKKVGKLLAIKNNRSWDVIEPKEIVDCQIIQDFITNECTPWNPDGDIQKALNQYMLQKAAKYGDKVLISDDAHYAFPEEKIIQEAKLGGMGDSFRFYGNYHRHTSDEAFVHFKETLGLDEKQFQKILNNNIEWAEKFKNFELKNEISLPTSFYPKNTLEHLIKLINEKGRMDWGNEVMKARLQSEIELIHKNGTIDLIPYFFLAEEGVRIHEEAEVLTGVGRGSAAGMLISYLLGITHIDPLKYDLSQDRFLTSDRIKTGKLPDIDQDLPNRDLLLPWLKSRFGNNSAQVSTNGLLRLKSSILNVARATWGSVPVEIELLTKSIPSTPQGVEDLDFIYGYVSEDEKEVKGLLETHDELKAYTKKYPEQWAIVLKMAGTQRSKGRHASAWVIADKPIDSFIPVMTIGGFRATAYTHKACEESGALKMDYLSLNTLIDIQGALRLIQQRSANKPIEKSYILNGKKVPSFRIVPFEGKMYDIWDLPERTEVFNEIADGKTETVFQLSTSSAKKWLKEFNYWTNDDRKEKSINSIASISAFTALDRPGPLDAIITDGVSSRNMLEEYASRARGEQPLDEIPFMTHALPETFGTMVYQEQLQSIYQQLTDCTGIEANKFREDVSKKKVTKINERFPSFIKAATDKIGAESAKKIWDQIFTFGQYGFNKSMDGTTILNYKGGQKQLKDFKGGEIVNGVNEHGNVIETEVVKLHNHGVLAAFEITFDDNSKVTSSINHKFLTEEGQKPLYEIINRGIEVYSRPEVNDPALTLLSQEEVSNLSQDKALDTASGTVLRKFQRQVKNRMAGIAYSDAPVSKTRSMVLRKIVRIRYMGPKQMYDLEVSHPKHNFLLPNGVVTSNSHSTSYAVTAYACAFLKYYFPLEWWCGVLQNAEKEEIAVKFWKHCKSFINLPEISLSEDNFTVKNNRIQAPIGMLVGVGPKAQQELSKYRPYTSITDFTDKISKHKRAGAKVLGEKVKAGTSALNRGVVSKLIVSGVMDTLFPSNLDTIGKLETFETALGVSLGKRTQKIKEEYRGITPIKIYQYKKEILPVYTDSLQKYLYDLHIDGVEKKIKTIGGVEQVVYTYLPTNPETIDYITKSFDKKEFVGKLVFVDGEILSYMDKDAIVDPNEPLHVAVAAYVIDARPFSFISKKTKKTKKAVEFTLDINGEVFKVVKWTTKQGEVIVPENPVIGSIVIAILGRWNERGFSIESIQKVVEPANSEPEKEELSEK